MRKTLLLALVLAACGDDAGQPIDAPPPDEPPIDTPPPPEYVTVIDVPVTANKNLDLLFVIDDSPSMTDKQSNLAQNFPSFVNQLLTFSGGLPNLHLGVISTDMGTLGTDAPTAGPPIGSIGQGGCAGAGDGGNLQTNGATVTGAFLRDVEVSPGNRQRNYTGSLAQVFSTMAMLGAGGCGFEQPLHAMKRALDNNPANAGFLRGDALLAVFFLTDEDDCSVASAALFGPESAELGPQQSFRCTRFGVTCAQGGVTPDAMNQPGVKSECTSREDSPYLDDVAGYRDFLVALKGDARKVIVAGVMGNESPFEVELRAPPNGGAAQQAIAHSCSYQGANGTEVADPAVRLGALLDEFPNRSARSTICQSDLGAGFALLAELLQQATGSPCIGATSIPDGADCYVEDVLGAQVTRIDACGTAPCFRIVTDDQTCTLGARQKLEVMRTATPDPATFTRLRCRL